MPPSENPDRRFPKPWAILESGESFRVVDATGFVICYIYYDDEKSRAAVTQRPNRKQASQLVTRIAKIGDQ